MINGCSGFYGMTGNSSNRGRWIFRIFAKIFCMYKRIIRPLLFLLGPEAVHRLVVVLVRFCFAIPFVKSVTSAFYNVRDEELRRDVFGLTFKNPVGLAAGFDKNATIYRQFAAFGFSFVEVGTATPVGQPGNARPRSFRLPADKALINRMGFNNHGAAAIAGRLGRKRSNLVIGGNIGKNTSTPNESAVEDYAKAFLALYDHVDYFTVNVSCPNISDLSHLQDRDQLAGILSRLSEIRGSMERKKPILVKISPDLNWDQIDDVLELVDAFNMDGIVATNTTLSREGLSTDPVKLQKIGDGGLSGEPIRERSTEIIRYIHEKTGARLPIIGVGGIMCAGDALEKLRAGATLIQIYTGFIYEGPGMVKKINRAILNGQASA
jgi:dihydroorotate dehydrogenase